MKETLAQKPVDDDPTALDQFAAPHIVQLRAVLLRVFQQYWRTPSYLYSKVALCAAVVCDNPHSICGITMTDVHRVFLWDFPSGKHQLLYRDFKTNYLPSSCCLSCLAISHSKLCRIL